MIDQLISNTITVTTVGQDNLVEFSVQRSAGGLTESVALSVAVPSEAGQTLRDVSALATQRGIGILQAMLRAQDPEGKLSIPSH